eukprot:1919028-Rhodomonas_salina.1
MAHNFWNFKKGSYATDLGPRAVWRFGPVAVAVAVAVVTVVAWPRWGRGLDVPCLQAHAACARTHFPSFAEAGGKCGRMGRGSETEQKKTEKR